MIFSTEPSVPAKDKISPVIKLALNALFFLLKVKSSTSKSFLKPSSNASPSFLYFSFNFGFVVVEYLAVTSFNLLFSVSKDWDLRAVKEFDFMVFTYSGYSKANWLFTLSLILLFLILASFVFFKLSKSVDNLFSTSSSFAFFHFFLLIYLYLL